MVQGCFEDLGYRASKCSLYFTKCCTSHLTRQLSMSQIPGFITVKSYSVLYCWDPLSHVVKTRKTYLPYISKTCSSNHCHIYIIHTSVSTIKRAWPIVHLPTGFKYLTGCVKWQEVIRSQIPLLKTFLVYMGVGSPFELLSHRHTGCALIAHLISIWWNYPKMIIHCIVTSQVFIQTPSKFVEGFW